MLLYTMSTVDKTLTWKKKHQQALRILYRGYTIQLNVVSYSGKHSMTVNREIKHRVYGKHEIQVKNFQNEK